MKNIPDKLNISSPLKGALTTMNRTMRQNAYGVLSGTKMSESWLELSVCRGGSAGRKGGNWALRKITLHQCLVRILKATVHES